MHTLGFLGREDHNYSSDFLSLYIVFFFLNRVAINFSLPHQFPILYYLILTFPHIVFSATSRPLQLSL